MKAKDFRGGSRSGIREYNERTILNFLRRYGPAPKAEVARETGLSAQSASVIVNTLLRDGLVRKGEKVRGQVGQPTTPIALDPDGAFSIGVKVGRRTVEVAAVDFTGAVRHHREVGYASPTRTKIEGHVKRQLKSVLDALDARERERLVGVGVAMPSQIGAWHEELGLAPDALADWASFDVRALVRDVVDLPLQVHNDTAAACAAEILLGTAIKVPSVLYVYVGTFVGGAVVLNGRLYEGQRGNAGALGSMPMGVDGEASQTQFIRRASVVFLEHALRGLGLTPLEQIAAGLPDPRAAEAFERWSGPAATSIAHAIACATSVIDFEDVVIDSVLRPPQLDALVAQVKAQHASRGHKGLLATDISVGSLGPRARVVGAAILPLISAFSPQQELLVKRSQRDAQSA